MSTKTRSYSRIEHKFNHFLSTECLRVLYMHYSLHTIDLNESHSLREREIKDNGRGSVRQGNEEKGDKVRW